MGARALRGRKRNMEIRLTGQRGLRGNKGGTYVRNRGMRGCLRIILGGFR